MAVLAFMAHHVVMTAAPEERVRELLGGDLLAGVQLPVSAKRGPAQPGAVSPLTSQIGRRGPAHRMI
jgi:hypothetical protein